MLNLQSQYLGGKEFLIYKKRLERACSFLPLSHIGTGHLGRQNHTIPSWPHSMVLLMRSWSWPHVVPWAAEETVFIGKRHFWQDPHLASTLTFFPMPLFFFFKLASFHLHTFLARKEQDLNIPSSLLSWCNQVLTLGKRIPFHPTSFFFFFFQPSVHWCICYNSNPPRLISDNLKRQDESITSQDNSLVYKPLYTVLHFAYIKLIIMGCLFHQFQNILNVSVIRFCGGKTIVRRKAKKIITLIILKYYFTYTCLSMLCDLSTQ
jgi:hypothetical protein